MDVLNSNVLGIRHIGQSRTLGILVGALRIPLTANPEFLPVVQAVAVDGATTTDGETVQPVGIDQGREVLARLTLDARRQNRIVGNALGAFQHGTL